MWHEPQKYFFGVFTIIVAYYYKFTLPYTPEQANRVERARVQKWNSICDTFGLTSFKKEMPKLYKHNYPRHGDAKKKELAEMKKKYRKYFDFVEMPKDYKKEEVKNTKAR